MGRRVESLLLLLLRLLPHVPLLLLRRERLRAHEVLLPDGLEVVAGDDDALWSWDGAGYGATALLGRSRGGTGEVLLLLWRVLRSPFHLVLEVGLILKRLSRRRWPL